jgi:hypothetical protein
MSLSSIIHDQKEFRDGLRARVVKPSISFGAIKAAPLTTNYRIVGTAFDYVLRFFLQRINSVAQTRGWIAENGVERIGTSEYEYDLDHNTLSHKADRKRRQADTYINEARSEHQAYLKTGLVTDKLLFAALRLAYLDVAVRAGPDRIDWVHLKSPDPKDVVDLHRLLALVNASSFRATRTCLLNPMFDASGLVGGADADLLLDDCLIEVKTTKNPHLDNRDFLQLIGYYFLHGFDGMHCGDSKSTGYEVNSLAIYFSRYGYLWKIPVEDILPPGSVPETAKWFFESVCTSKSERLKYLRGFRGPLAKHLCAQKQGAKKTSKPRLASKKRGKKLMSNPRFQTDARKSGARR